jgi:bifunctional enzyme CysN/CysC
VSTRLAFAGHVDHGKSTVIGRLLSETRQVRDDKYQKVKNFCESTGRKFEFAFLLDALQEEQHQGITIDVTEVPWNFEGREFTLIDTPGHREFLKNMIGGASRADAAVLILDAHEGVQAHFKKQISVFSLLNTPYFIVLLNKMDLVHGERSVYEQRRAEVGEIFKANQLPDPLVIPVAAWSGDNLLSPSQMMPWYEGPHFAQAVMALPQVKNLAHQPLRFPLQDVYKFDDKRIYVGRVESGEVRVGDELRFLPSGRSSRVTSIEVHGQAGKTSAGPGEAIGLTLADPLFLERGELGFHPDRAPRMSQSLTADIFWLSPQPLIVGHKYKFRSSTSELRAQIEAIESVYDAHGDSAAQIENGGVGRIRLSLDGPLAHDFYKECESTGRFILVDGYLPAGGGRILSDKRAYLFSEKSQVSPSERLAQNGHGGVVIWLTGLSGSGKSTIAKDLEKKLFAAGSRAFILDGDNLRQGLCADLGFSDVDRAENIRRTAEVAKLFADAGLVSIVSLISPFRADREKARSLIGPDRFIEVHVDCPLEECGRRDPKGLYSKVKTGEITQFTGVSSAYEMPARPDVHIETHRLTLEESVDQILDFLTAFAAYRKN